MRVAESGFQREAGEGGTKRGEEFSCLLYGIDPFGRLPTYQNGAGIKLSLNKHSSPHFYEARIDRIEILNAHFIHSHETQISRLGKRVGKDE